MNNQPSSDSVTFSAEIVKIGPHTQIELPFDPDIRWGEKLRHDVTGVINRFTYRGPVKKTGGACFLRLGPAWLRDSGLAAGASVEVTIRPEGPQVDLLAEDIAAALRSQPVARRFFDSLPTFYRNNYIRWIESAKRPETRQARIQAAVEFLAAGKRQK